MSKKSNYIFILLIIIIIAMIVYVLIPSDNTIKVTGIIINKSNLKLSLGSSEKLEGRVFPINATNQTIIWESENPNIANVSSDGIVVANNVGETYIFVKDNEGNKYDKCLVKVIKEEEIPRIFVLIDKNVEIKKNETKTLKYTVSPVEDKKLIRWTSSDKRIVTVNNGVIKGISGGKATITAKLDNQVLTTQVTVTVPVNSIKLNKTTLSLKKGQSTTLIATINPSDSTNKSIKWKSSDEKIVSVDNSGKVMGVGLGVATIEATIEGKKATCQVASTGYVMTDDTKFSKYSVVDLYNSLTLKYRILKYKNDYFSLIWVMDANKQWNSALPSYGSRFSTDSILDTEIRNYGYSKKGLIATNGGPFWDGWGDRPCIPFIMNKGRMILDIENKTINKKVYETIGMTKEGLLKVYNFNNNYSHNLTVKQQMISDGVRNNFSLLGTVVKNNGEIWDSTSLNKRTMLCQVDNNNFIMYSGSHLSIKDAGIELKNNFGCKTVYNMDGGGSRAFYYKKSTMTSAKKQNSGRSVVDMMYFVEQ